MLHTFWMFASRNYHLDIFGESFRQPKSYISLLTSLIVSESIDCLDNYHHFLVDLLRTVNYLLLLDLGAHDVQPVTEKFTDVFLEKIDTLRQLESFLQFYNDLIKRIVVVTVVAASACKMSDSQHFFFFSVIRNSDSFFPLTKYSFHTCSWFSSKDKCFFIVFFKPSIDFMNMFFLSRPYFFWLVMI